MSKIVLLNRDWLKRTMPVRTTKMEMVTRSSTKVNPFWNFFYCENMSIL